MSLTLLAVLLQDAPAADSGTGTVRMITGALAVVLVVIIVFRRKGKGGKKDEEEF